MAWEAVVPAKWWRTAQSEEGHLAFRGARLLGSLMYLFKKGKPDGIRPAV